MNAARAVGNQKLLIFPPLCSKDDQRRILTAVRLGRIPEENLEPNVQRPAQTWANVAQIPAAIAETSLSTGGPEIGIGQIENQHAAAETMSSDTTMSSGTERIYTPAVSKVLTPSPVKAESNSQPSSFGPASPLIPVIDLSSSPTRVIINSRSQGDLSADLWT